MRNRDKAGGFSEFPLSETFPTENDISVDQPGYFAPEGWSDFLTKNHQCSSSVSIAFPIAYLSLTDDELKESHRKVSELLVQPTEEDIDRKRRILSHCRKERYDDNSIPRQNTI